METNQWRRLALLGALIFTLQGCMTANTSQAPLAATYPVSHQQKMQAAHHWDVLAQHESSLIAESLSKSQIAVYVSDDNTQTTFDRGFKNLLTSQLVQTGTTVKAVPNNSAVISYEVEVVQHKSRDKIRQEEGTWTLLAAGVAVANHAVKNWGTPTKLLIPAALSADLFSGSLVDESNFEVIITTNAVYRDQILHSSSNIYYINGSATEHYEQQTKTINVKG